MGEEEWVLVLSRPEADMSLDAKHISRCRCQVFKL